MELLFNELEKITVVFDKTASHNVDPQKGFTPLCPNELPVPDGHNIVSELVGQNELVAYRTVSKDMHPVNAIWLATKKDPQYTIVEGENVDIRWNAHCMSGTKGAELLDGLGEMKDYDFFIAKGYEPDLHPYSSCYHDLKKSISTGLIEWYNSKNISTIIVGGLALNMEDTPLCVGETVIDLVNAGFQVILNLGSTRGLGSEEGRFEFINMLIEKYGVLVVGSYKDIDVI
jgi:nicotinamidase/pyrazinamidase